MAGGNDSAGALSGDAGYYDGCQRLDRKNAEKVLSLGIFPAKWRTLRRGNRRIPEIVDPVPLFCEVSIFVSLTGAGGGILTVHNSQSRFHYFLLSGIHRKSAGCRNEGGFVNIIGIFRCAVAGTPQIADNVSGLDDGSLLSDRTDKGNFCADGHSSNTVFVKAADAKPPAAVLVPANGFHNSGFDGNNGSSGLA